MQYSFSNQNTLLLPFYRLERLVHCTATLRDLDPVLLLEPFLDIIYKGETTGIITHLGLKSLEKFIEYRIVDAFHPDIQQAVDKVTYALVRCKFEATDYVGDEVVLQTLLRCMTTLIESDLKKFVSDRAMMDMIRVAIGIVFQPRVGEHLRKSGEDCVLVMIGKVMERFVDISHLWNWNDSTTTHAASFLKSRQFGLQTVVDVLQTITSLLDPHDHKHTDTLHRFLAMKMMIKIVEMGSKCLGVWVRYGRTMGGVSRCRTVGEKDSGGGDVGGVGGVVAHDVDVNEMAKEGVHAEESDIVHGQSHVVHVNPGPTEENPSSPKNSETSKIVEMIDKKETFIETDNSLPIDFHITFPSSLYRLFTNDILKHLLQLLFLQPQYVNNPPSAAGLNVIQMVLKCLVAVVGVCDEVSDGSENQVDVLYAHREYLIRTVCERMGGGLSLWDLERWGEDAVFSTENNNPTTSTSRRPSDSTSKKRLEIVDPTVRYLFIQSLQHLLTPDTILRMWMSSDCEEWSRSFLVRDTVHAICQMGVGDTKGVLGTGVLLAGLDCVLAILKKWVDRLPNENAIKTPTFLSNLEKVESEWQAKKELKSIVMKGSTLFSENVRTGIEFFQQHGLLPITTTDDDVAQFFYESTLDKTQVGNYLAKPKHLPLLKKFSTFFEFKGKRIDEALRIYLDKFRLPGESQQIERILDTFADQYFASHVVDPQHDIASAEATGILAFSIIMLNTDQHNPQVRVITNNPEKNVID
jgi:hypothetical protein